MATADISPRGVIARVASAVPEDCRRNIVIIGSLAAGYQLFPAGERQAVRTKDVDCVLSPRVEAVEKGAAIVTRLLSAGWTPRTDGPHGVPGEPDTPDADLPLVRLFPPDTTDWFIGNGWGQVRKNNLSLPIVDRS